VTSFAINRRKTTVNLLQQLDKPSLQR